MSDDVFEPDESPVFPGPSGGRAPSKQTSIRLARQDDVDTSTPHEHRDRYDSAVGVAPDHEANGQDEGQVGNAFLETPLAADQATDFDDEQNVEPAPFDPAPSADDAFTHDVLNPPAPDLREATADVEPAAADQSLVPVVAERATRGRKKRYRLAQARHAVDQWVRRRQKMSARSAFKKRDRAQESVLDRAGRWLRRSRKRDTPVVGVDIGTAWIKLVELRAATDDAQPWTIECYATEPCPEGSVTQDGVEDIEAVAEAIRRAVERSATRARQAAVAVTGPLVLNKTISLAADMTDAEVEQQLIFDCERHLGESHQNLNLDFELGAIDPENTTKRLIHVTACRSAPLETITAAVHMAGLKPAVIDIEPYVFENACRLLVSQPATAAITSPVAVFDIGQARTHMAVIERDVCVYYSELSIGAMNVAQTLIRDHDLAGMTALSSFLETPGAAGQLSEAAIREFVDELSDEFRRAFVFFDSAANSDLDIAHVLLTGGGALLPGIAEHLDERLSVPVTQGNLAEHATLAQAAKRNDVLRSGPGLMLAAGLSMRGLS